MSKHDALGIRMKEFYENRTRFSLPRRTNYLVRVDGKAFHTYTRGLNRPFDSGLIEDMNAVAAHLCKNMQGAKFAYVQSDEISVVMTDYDDISTDAWFDGNIQKIASVAASLATAKFLHLRTLRTLKELKANRESDSKTIGVDEAIDAIERMKLAEFDGRAFSIPFTSEVVNYFIWRQQDATRNSIQAVAQTMYSDNERLGKSSDELQEMIFQKGLNFNDLTYREKRGAVITKVEYEKNGAMRNRWESVETPIFTQDKQFLYNLLPDEN